MSRKGVVSKLNQQGVWLSKHAWISKQEVGSKENVLNLSRKAVLWLISNEENYW